LISSYAALGFDAMSLPFGELYGALQTGLVDGQTQPMSTNYFMSFYEQQDYITNLGCEVFIAIVLVNRGFYDSLPEDIQNKLHEVWDDFLLPSGYDSIEREQKYMNLMKEEKPELTFYELTDEEMEPFRERAMPLRDVYLEIGGEGAQEILDTLLADIEAAKAKLGVE
jgi:TRAP-type C4-dicarboxylate transport system substrate-binding protein